MYDREHIQLNHLNSIRRQKDVTTTMDEYIVKKSLMSFVVWYNAGQQNTKYRKIEKHM